MAGDFTQSGVEAVVKGFSKFNQDLNAMNKAIAASGKASIAAAKDSTAFNKALSSVASGALTAITRGLVQFGKAVVREGSAFTKEMSNVAAVSGAVGKDFEALEKQAKTLGATTKFTATEAAEGMSFLAMAGFETSEIIAAMPGTLNLAAAANLDLGTSADIVSNILSGFGANAESTGQFVDVLSKTFTTSNTSLQQLGQGMKFAAPVAKSLGVTVEDTAAAMGVLGNAGIQGALAGTTLRGVLLSLSAPTSKAKALMEELGIAVFDTQGNMLPLPQIIGNINTATAGMTQEQRNAALQTLVGSRRLAGLNVLLAEGEPALQAYGDQLRDSVGTAAEIADKQLDNLSGDFTLLQSAVSGFEIGAFEALEPALRGATQASTELVLNLTEGLDSWTTTLSQVDAIAGALATSSDAMDEQGKQAGLAAQAMGTFNDFIETQITGIGLNTVELLKLTVGEEALTDAVMTAIPPIEEQNQTLAENASATVDTTASIDELATAQEGLSATQEQVTKTTTDQTAQNIELLRYQNQNVVVTRDWKFELEQYKAAQEAAAEAEQQRLQTMGELASQTADFFLSSREARTEALESEQAYNASIASIREGAADKQAEAEQALSDKLADIEQQRAEKKAYILTGSGAKTNEQLDADLAYWNAHFDELTANEQASYAEREAALQADLSARESAAQAARAKEVAEQQEHLNELKLNAALATLETTGQLAQFTGGLAVSAQEAAELIKAGVLPVTQELAASVQATLGELQTQEAATSAQASANQSILQDAFAGTLEPINQQAMALGTTLPAGASATQEAMNLMNQESLLGLQNTNLATQNQDLALQNVSNVTLPFLQQTMSQTNTQAQSELATTQTATESEDAALDAIASSTLPALSAEFGVAGQAGQKMAEEVTKGVDKAKDKLESLKDIVHEVAVQFDAMAEAARRAAEAARSAGSASAMSSGIGFSQGIGLQNGVGFNTLGLGVTVPSGYPNDTFGPLFLSSGEELLVTPRGTSIDDVVRDRLVTDRSSVTNNNQSTEVNMIFQAPVPTQQAIQSYQVMSSFIGD